MRPLIFVLYHLCIACVNGLRDGNLKTSEFSQIVVIPDTHGDVVALLRSLLLAIQVADEPAVVTASSFMDLFRLAIDNDTYPATPLSTATDIALVQLGDLVDRGPYSHDCVRTISAIPRIIGWPVIALYGNHEIMTFLEISGEFVHPNDTVRMGGPDERKAAFRPGGSMYESIAGKFLHVARLVSDRTPVADWWHFRNPATLFVHGGVDMQWMAKELGTSDVNVLNLIAQSAVLDGEESDLKTLNEDDSFVWSRVLAKGNERLVCEFIIDPILRHFKVGRVVLGHTPQLDKRAKTRCGGKIILTDVLMSRWMTSMVVDEKSGKGGRPVAIVLKVDEKDGLLDSIVAHYTDLATGTEHERDELYVPSRLEATLPFPRLLELVSRSKAVVILRAEAGIVNIFLDQKDMDLYDVKHPLLPGLADRGMVPTGAWFPGGSASGSYQYVFIRTDCVHPIALLGISEAVRDGITAIMHIVHESGHVIGISSSVDVVDFFGANSNGTQVALINWSRIQPRQFDGHDLVEAGFIRRALHM